MNTAGAVNVGCQRMRRCEWAELPDDLIFSILSKLPILELARLASASERCATIYKTQLSERQAAAISSLDASDGRRHKRQLLTDVASDTVDLFLAKGDAFAVCEADPARRRQRFFGWSEDAGKCLTAECLARTSMEEPEVMRIDLREDIGRIFLRDMFFLVAYCVCLCLGLHIVLMAEVVWSTLATYFSSNSVNAALSLVWCITLTLFVGLVLGGRYSARFVQHELVISAHGVRISLAGWNRVWDSPGPDSDWGRGRLRSCTALLDAASHGDAVWMLALLKAVESYREQFAPAGMNGSGGTASHGCEGEARGVQWNFHSESFHIPRGLHLDEAGFQRYRKGFVSTVLLPRVPSLLVPYLELFCTPVRISPLLDLEPPHLVLPLWKYSVLPRFASSYLGWRLTCDLL